MRVSLAQHATTEHDTAAGVTRFVILVPDGMADEPIDALGGRTPMEAAATPCMDALAAAGEVGLVRTVPAGMPAGSDVANLSVLGYDPRAVYTGRAPLEAVSMGVKLGPGDIAYRCNFVTIADGLMRDNTAGSMDSEAAAVLIAALRDRFAGSPFEFHPGVSYRHLMVWRDGMEAECTPPHDILDRPVGGYWPRDLDGEAHAAAELMRVMESAHEVLGGLRPGTDIWLWGQGTAPRLPLLAEQRGLRGAVVAAVDLIRGIGVAAGMDVIEVPGATGDLETDYAAKGAAAVAALGDHDLVLVHVEAPDEAGHQGDALAKVTAIERVDAEVLAPILAMPHPPALLVLTDHPTPVRLRTHTDPPVPFVIATPAESAEAAAPSASAKPFTEAAAAAAGLLVGSGPELMDRFLARAR